MADIRLFFLDLDSGCDIASDPLGLVMDDGLDTAVLLSLFTDRRAEAGDEFSGDPRGWWGDALAVTDDRPVAMGSRFWLLAREKQTVPVLRRAEAYARQALQWMLDDGVASALTATASNPQRGWLWLDVLIDNTPYQFRIKS